jgi:hypothetical protein
MDALSLKIPNLNRLAPRPYSFFPKQINSELSSLLENATTSFWNWTHTYD